MGAVARGATPASGYHDLSVAHWDWRRLVRRRVRRQSALGLVPAHAASPHVLDDNRRHQLPAYPARNAAWRVYARRAGARVRSQALFGRERRVHSRTIVAIGPISPLPE